MLTVKVKQCGLESFQYFSKKRQSLYQFLNKTGFDDLLETNKIWWMWHLFTSKLYENRKINFHLISLESPALEEDSWRELCQPIVSTNSKLCEEAWLSSLETDMTKPLWPLNAAALRIPGVKLNYSKTSELQVKLVFFSC